MRNYHAEVSVEIPEFLTERLDIFETAMVAGLLAKSLACTFLLHERNHQVIVIGRHYQVMLIDGVDVWSNTLSGESIHILLNGMGEIAASHAIDRMGLHEVILDSCGLNLRKLSSYGV